MPTIVSVLLNALHPLIALSLALVAPVGGQAQAAPLTGLDQYVESSMKAWKIPGLAIAVVHQGKVVLARGYGARRVGSPEPVTEETLFAIGSATKTFTTTAIGMLTEQGKLSLDEPVIRYRPDFRLVDPVATRDATLRDLLSHRTGLAGGDFLWATGEFDRDEIVRRAGTIAPAWSFRSRFDYSNVMFIEAGQSWDDLVRTRILDPLGMKATVTSIRSLPVAGGINSNVREMARWLQFQLASGSVEGRQLVSKAFIEAMRTPETLIKREGSWAMMSPEGHFMAYGLGWLMSDYRGRQLLQHGGGIDGMSAIVAVGPLRRNLPGRDLRGSRRHARERNPPRPLRTGLRRAARARPVRRLSGGLGQSGPRNELPECHDRRNPAGGRGRPLSLGPGALHPGSVMDLGRGLGLPILSSMRTLLMAVGVLLSVPRLAAGQVTYSHEAIEELQSITVRADVMGPGDNGRLARLLEDIVRQELTRADILYERGDPRADDCCTLRLDVRLTTGAGRARFGVGYTVRLELGYRDRLGNAPTWTTVWAGRMLSNIVERSELDQSVRSAALELVADFADRYREYFPRR